MRLLAATPIVILLALGCSKSTNGPAPADPTTVQNADPTTPAEPPRFNGLPPAFAGVDIGMSLAEFKSSRDTSHMKVVVAMNTDDLGGTVPGGVEAELDRLERAMDGTKDPNYDPNKGLHYLEEPRDDKPIVKVQYEFADGRLEVVIVFYESVELANAAAREVMGGEPNAGDKWIAEGKEGAPTVRVFVYEHKLVVGNDAVYANAKKADKG